MNSHWLSKHPGDSSVLISTARSTVLLNLSKCACRSLSEGSRNRQRFRDIALWKMKLKAFMLRAGRVNWPASAIPRHASNWRRCRVLVAPIKIYHSLNQFNLAFNGKRNCRFSVGVLPLILDVPELNWVIRSFINEIQLLRCNTTYLVSFLI